MTKVLYREKGIFRISETINITPKNASETNTGLSILSFKRPSSQPNAPVNITVKTKMKLKVEVINSSCALAF
jgi:hypothetical protein